MIYLKYSVPENNLKFATITLQYGHFPLKSQVKEYHVEHYYV